jgi:hypothetical protein
VNKILTSFDGRKQRDAKAVRRRGEKTWEEPQNPLQLLYLWYSLAKSRNKREAENLDSATTKNCFQRTEKPRKVLAS